MRFQAEEEDAWDFRSLLEEGLNEGDDGFECEAFPEFDFRFGLGLLRENEIGTDNGVGGDGDERLPPDLIPTAAAASAPIKPQSSFDSASAYGEDPSSSFVSLEEQAGSETLPSVDPVSM
jgi:hypothetical protein